MCNRSLTEGIVPLELKLANVLPLFKSGETMLLNYYRPVSLLCTLSKVFEKIMYSRLLNFLDNHKIVIGNQFGFRELYSSYMALMSMMDQVTKALDNGECVIGIFLDFLKVFETVNHSTVWRRYNAANFPTNIYKRHSLPSRMRYGVPFVDPASDLYSTSVPVFIYVISYNI